MQQFRLSNEAIAALYHIQLPQHHELPPGYPSVRSWLANKVRTLEGKSRDGWSTTKADPVRLQHVRQQNKLRARKYRERKQLEASRARAECVK
jgi:hypothetical protein